MNLGKSIPYKDKPNRVYFDRKFKDKLRDNQYSSTIRFVISKIIIPINQKIFISRRL